MKGNAGAHILNFLLCTFLVLACLILIILNTLLNKDFVSKEMTKINYQENVYNNIVENFQNNLLSANLDLKIEDIVNLEMVSNDVKSVIDYVYDKDSLQTRDNDLKANIKKAEEELLDGIYLDSDNKEAIEKLENNLLSIYQNEILINRNILKSLSNNMETIKAILSVIFVILLLVSLNIGAIIKILLKKRINVAVLASGMILLGLYWFLANSFSDVLIINPVFSLLLKESVSTILNMMLVYATFLIVSSIIVSIALEIKTNLND